MSRDRTTAEVAPCLDCGTTGGRLQHQGDTTRPKRCRGLCNTCYRRHKYRGTLYDFPRDTLPVESLLDAWHTVERRAGDTRAAHARNVAARLGMSFEAVERAILRARAKGLVA